MAHVFISYVRENRDVVDKLATELRERGVVVWLDRNNIDPGVRWREAIKKAIQSGSFFVACFWQEYNERDKTYMNEELTLTIDELRKRPSDTNWFIPILLNQASSASDLRRQVSTVELHFRRARGRRRDRYERICGGGLQLEKRGGARL